MAKKAKKRKANTSRALVSSSEVRAIMTKAASEMGLEHIHVDKEYRVTKVARKFILWMEYENRDTGVVERKPYAEHDGLVDALKREGFREVDNDALEPVPCIKAGCQGATEKDYQQRTKTRIVLKNGQTWSAIGAACRHNTTSMIHGKKNSTLAMSETRSMGRVIRRLLNTGIMSIMELPEIDKTVRWKKGDRAITARGVERIVESQVISGESVPIEEHNEAAPTEPAAAKGKTAKAPAEPATEEEPIFPENTPERVKANAGLHAVISKRKLPTDPMHKHLCELVTGARRCWDKPVKSVKEMTTEELDHARSYIEKLSDGQIATLAKALKT